MLECMPQLIERVRQECLRHQGGAVQRQSSCIAFIVSMMLHAVIRTKTSKYLVQDIRAAEREMDSRLHVDGTDEAVEHVDAQSNCRLILRMQAPTALFPSDRVAGTCQHRNTIVHSAIKYQTEHSISQRFTITYSR